MADSLSPITSCATTHGSGIRNRRRTQSSKARIFQLLISGSAGAFCRKRLDQNTEMRKGDARAAAAIAEILRDFLEAAVILETSNDRARRDLVLSIANSSTKPCAQTKAAALGQFPFAYYILRRTSRHARLRDPEPAKDSEFKSRNLPAFELWIRQEPKAASG
jgi:hypothetical protein